MKSKTSFSNLTVFRKNITRFAPVWVIYFVGLLLILCERFPRMDYDRLAHSIPEMIESFGIVNLIYAGMIALLMFGDLYNTRMCYSLHALPQRRESWLVSHLAAGTLFALVPNLVTAGLMAVALERYWYLGLYWLLAVTLEFVFFYGVATVSALLVGNRFAGLAVYAGLNFVSVLAYWLVETVYMPMLEGVVLEQAPFLTLCPVVKLFRAEYMRFECLRVPQSFGGYELHYKFLSLSDGWGYLAVLGVIGLALMGLGVWLYRKRHLECAGDFIAFSNLNGPACIIMALCVAGVFAFVGDEMIGEAFLLWFAVGLVVGWFGSRMLLQRRLRVFQIRAFVGLGILALLLTGSFLLIYHDVFNIKNYVPETEDVQSVTIANYAGAQLTDELNGAQIRMTLTDPEQIKEIMEAHGEILEGLDREYEGGSHRVTIFYKLRSGMTVTRSYRAPRTGRQYETFQRYFYTAENILGYHGRTWEEFVAAVEVISMDGGEISRDQYGKVLEALRADCIKGHVGTSQMIDDSVLWLHLQYKDQKGIWNERMLQVTHQAYNTLAVLQTPEVIFGGLNEEQLLAQMEYMALEGTEVDRQHWPALIGAMMEDCKKGGIGLWFSDNTWYTIEMQMVDDESGGALYRTVNIYLNGVNTINYLNSVKPQGK